MGKIFICTKKTDFDSVYKNENCDPNIPYILKVASNPKFVFLKLLYKKVLLKQKILFFDASRIRGGEDK